MRVKTADLKKYLCEYNKKWRERNREKCLEVSRLWRVNHKEQGLVYGRKYYKLHRKHILAQLKISQKRYFNTEKGKRANRRNTHKQVSKRRNLGHICLNNLFDGCHAHHINCSQVIHIPAEVHVRLKHCVWTGFGMDRINLFAIAWLQSDCFK